MIVFENENENNNEVQETKGKEILKRTIVINMDDLFGTEEEQLENRDRTEEILNRVPIYEGHEFDQFFPDGRVILCMAYDKKPEKIGWVKRFNQGHLRKYPKEIYLLYYRVLKEGKARILHFIEMVGKVDGEKFTSNGKIVFYNQSVKGLPYVGFKTLEESIDGVKKTFVEKLVVPDKYIDENIPYMTGYKELRKEAIRELLYSGIHLQELKV